MQRSYLQQRLDTLWAAIIDELTFDPLRKKIEFIVHAVDYGKVTHSKLVFEEVASFHWLQSTGEARNVFYEYEEGDHLELSLVQHFPGGMGTVGFLAQGEWDHLDNFIPNFAIEMYQQVLHLEARVVIIDGERFEVGFVNN
ncbi:YxiG family protein [Tumebacillus lacus]